MAYYEIDADCLTPEEERALAGFRNEHLPGISHHELIGTWMRRKGKLLADKLQPHADALFTHVVNNLEPYTIVEKLKEVVTTFTHPHELRVPLMQFNHCEMPHNYRTPVTSPAHAYWLEQGKPEAKRADLIHKHGLRGLICTKVYDHETDDFDYELHPEELIRVFNKTDVKERIALYFGGMHFTVSLGRTTSWELVEGEQLYQQTVTLYLNYYPMGVPAKIRKQLAKAAVKYDGYIGSIPPLANIYVTDGKEMWSAE